MNALYLPFLDGAISGFIFVGSSIPSLLKAYKTRDMRSYSGLNLLLVNAGNAIHWLYVIRLPIGPIWVLYTFYTVFGGVFLPMYLRLCQDGVTDFH